MVVGVVHRHGAHVTNIPADIADAADAPLVAVLVVLVLVTHLAFSLTEAINYEEEESERHGGGDARRY